MTGRLSFSRSAISLASPKREGATTCTRADAVAKLHDIASRPGANDKSRVSVLLANAEEDQTLTITHVLWAMFGLLPEGQVQRPPRHQSVALDLILDAQPGCYTLLGTRLDELTRLIEPYGMTDYVETFHEEHVWDTNWKILAENFMESYHLPMLHRATVGPHSRLEEMECPPGHAAFNYHWITKEASLPIGNAHPDNTRLQGHWRRTTALLAIYPTHLVTLTPGYFWYLLLQPRAWRSCGCSSRCWRCRR